MDGGDGCGVELDLGRARRYKPIYACCRLNRLLGLGAQEVLQEQTTSPPFAGLILNSSLDKSKIQQHFSLTFPALERESFRGVFGGEWGR